MADDTRDPVAATLAGAKRIADGLQFACRIPDKVPDFTACGGPAAEAYWDYFTPGRISSLLAAVEAVLALTGKRADQARYPGSAEQEALMWERQRSAKELREAITAALTGEAGGGN